MPLIKALRSLNGNPRACIYTEPLWGIPYNLYIPFFTLYMYSLNLGDVEIGILLSVGLFFQLFASLAGGLLADRYGRRRVVLAADLFSWTIPTLLWAFSQNFWWFFVAAFFNGAQLISTNAWQCLMVEDAEPGQIVPIYNWIYVCGLLAVFFAPLSGTLIARFTITSGMRALFIIAAVLMTAKCILLYRFSTETKQGLIRMRETKHESIMKLLSGYKGVLMQILRTPDTLRVLALMALSNISLTVTAHFFPLYATQNLRVAEHFLVWFPILRAVVMLCFFFFIQNYFDRWPIRRVILAGLGFYGAGHVLLLTAPAGSVAMLMLYTAVDACAAALFLPRRDALLIHDVDPAERSRITSLIFTIMLGLSSPFGYIAGRISLLDRRLPFALNIVLFGMMAVIAGSGKPARKAE